MCKYKDLEKKIDSTDLDSDNVIEFTKDINKLEPNEDSGDWKAWNRLRIKWNDLRINTLYAKLETVMENHYKHIEQRIRRLERVIEE